MHSRVKNSENRANGKWLGTIKKTLELNFKICMPKDNSATSERLMWCTQSSALEWHRMKWIKILIVSSFFDREILIQPLKTVWKMLFTQLKCQRWFSESQHLECFSTQRQSHFTRWSPAIMIRHACPHEKPSEMKRNDRQPGEQEQPVNVHG